MSESHHYTLLFVDDERNILSALRRIFRNDGYQILTAESGAEALLLLEEHDVSVIISDQRLPNMNGAELLTQSKLVAPHAIRIMLTGYSDIDDAVKSINDGQVFRYLTKPWDDREFKFAILQALVYHDLSRRNERLVIDLKEKNADLAQRLEQTQAQPAADGEREIQRLKEENARLRKGLKQRDQLLRTWQSQLNQLYPLNDQTNPPAP